jgi:putative transposase
MAERYELTDTLWQLIRELLPGKASDPGRTAANNRLFIRRGPLGAALRSALA